ncbi:MAG: VWA domain-containing protein [Pseudomonadota bacterium]|nr:VWA domain-containing protein [Pseudomonadota bacterium]
MEEFVGKIWHRLITGAAQRQYPEAAVTLDEIRSTAGILFRALGGEGGLRVENATAVTHGARRSLLQRIAGSGKQAELAWRDEETLRLPGSIALFPERSLNRDLYLWLAALAADPESPREIWFSASKRRTARVLERFPGLRDRYRRLVEAHLAGRPNPDSLPDDEAAWEQAIRAALQHPGEALTPPPTPRRPPQPVPLWLHPAPPQVAAAGGQQDAPEDDEQQPGGKQQEQERKKRKGERAEMPDGKDGLVAFRLESLFSWAEYVKVDRTTEEDEDEDAKGTADDMEVITVARDNQSTASKLRLDLDLPSEEYDDIRLGDGIPLPEWDYKRQQLIRDHCRLQPMLARDASPMDLPERLRPQARKLRSQFEILRPHRIWLHGQKDGQELDLESYITHATDRMLGYVNSEADVYRDFRNASRDLSCLLLADLSLSTDAWVSDNARVIDIIRDSLFLFSEALSATGDRFALYGFSSRKRSHNRFHILKNFAERYSAHTRGRINAIKPGYYTRMGAAIRNAADLLAEQPSAQKILLLLTDGKPNDLDKYEGRYGIEDTRMALLEAERKGLQPFCVTIDEQAQEYLPYLFGSRSYVLIRKAEELPRKLPLLYLRLSR